MDTLLIISLWYQWLWEWWLIINYGDGYYCGDDDDDDADYNDDDDYDYDDDGDDDDGDDADYKDDDDDDDECLHLRDKGRRNGNR